MSASATRGLEVETAAFNRSLHQYVDFTSRTAVVALNGKSRDLMFMAAKLCPKADRSKIVAGIRLLRSVAVHRLYNTAGMTARGHGPNPQPFSTLDVTKKMLRTIHPAVNYMKSGFVKAAKKYPKNDASALPEVPIGMGRFNTRAEARMATITSLMAETIAAWGTLTISDSEGKRVIVNKALEQAVTWVRLDIEKYIMGKLYGEAKNISARRAA